MTYFYKDKNTFDQERVLVYVPVNNLLIKR